MKKLILMLIACVFLMTACATDSLWSTAPKSEIRKQTPPYITIKEKTATTVPTDIFNYPIKEFFDYVNNETEIKHIVIRIHSPGGPITNAMRIISIMNEFKRNGGHVECRVYGAAASAGFIVFINGDNRLISKVATLCIHNIEINADGTHNKSLSATYYMNLMINLMADKSKLSIVEIKELIKDTRFTYLTPTEAIEYGFADGYIT